MSQIALEPFEAQPNCPKCGRDGVWQNHDGPILPWVQPREYLACTCRYCSYRWKMACRDAQTATNLLRPAEKE